MDEEGRRHALVPVRDVREAVLIAGGLLVALLVGLAIPTVAAEWSILTGLILAVCIGLGWALWQRQRPRVPVLPETVLLVGDAPELEIIAARARAPRQAGRLFLGRAPTIDVLRVPDVAAAAELVRDIACQEMVVADREFSNQTCLQDCRGYAVRTVRISEKLAQWK